jgi:ABC-type nitrate/sulfonate/bicarbonate transport system permease component
VTTTTQAARGGLGPRQRALLRFYEANQRPILGVAGILSVLVPWELLSRARLVKTVLISAPSHVVEAFITEIKVGELAQDVAATLQVWIAGYLLAAVVGVLIGLAGGWFRRVSYIAIPWLNVLYATPNLAFIPMFVLWFGIGFTFKVWIVFLGALFYVAINTLTGVHATEDRYLAVARTYGASRVLIFKTIVLPGSVPYIITGLRLGASRALVGVIAAEFISANVGLGFLISVAGATLNTARVMMGIVIIASFGVVVGEILRRVERHFDVWRREVNG